MPNPERTPGRTDWFDLPAANLADAMSFYEALLGWTYRQMDHSPIKDYVMIEVKGTLIGGIRKVDSRPTGEGPILYFRVVQLAPKVVRAKELGAVIVGPTVELGMERGLYQWIRDREGNLIGLWGQE